MKNTLFSLVLIFLTFTVYSQEQNVKLNPPSKNRGTSVMKALEQRASATVFDTAMLNLQDLSDLLWAANGINRPESGKRTAPSAVNAQDIDVYVIMKKGAYLYDAKNQELKFVAEGDHRGLVAGRQANFANAPVFLVLISDISRFRGDDKNSKLNMAAMDAGIVSQNIAIFCASVDLITRPRGTMDTDKLRQVLRLTDNQYPMLNNPVSCQKKQ